MRRQLTEEIDQPLKALRLTIGDEDFSRLKQATFDDNSFGPLDMTENILLRLGELGERYDDIKKADIATTEAFVARIRTRDTEMAGVIGKGGIL